MTRESDIMHEAGSYWVSREKVSYTVWRIALSGTHSFSDSAYPKTPAGLSIAVARCDYLAKRSRTNA